MERVRHGSGGRGAHARLMPPVAHAALRMSYSKSLGTIASECWNALLKEG